LNDARDQSEGQNLDKFRLMAPYSTLHKAHGTHATTRGNLRIATADQLLMWALLPHHPHGSVTSRYSKTCSS